MGKKATAEAEFTWAQACRDIVTAAINKGQLLPLLAGMIILLIVWRMPATQMGALVGDILADLRSGSLLGYALFVITVAGWGWHAKRARDLNHALLTQVPAALSQTAKEKAK